MKKIKIEEFLPMGKENAVSADILCNLTGIPDKRSLQKAISKERSEGSVILSCSSGGYYLPGNYSEAAEFVRTWEKMAKNTLATLRSAKNYLNDIEGQMQLELEEK